MAVAAFAGQSFSSCSLFLLAASVCRGRPIPCDQTLTSQAPLQPVWPRDRVPASELLGDMA